MMDTVSVPPTESQDLPTSPQTDEGGAVEFPVPQETVQKTYAEEVREAPKTFAAFKCHFFTPKRDDIRGAFCLIFDGLNGEIAESVFWISLDASRVPTEVSSPWKDFTKNIPGLGPYEKTIGAKMTAQLMNVFSRSVRTGIFQNDKDPLSVSKPLEELRRDYERLIHYFIEFETNLEHISRRDLVDAGILPDGKESSPQSGRTVSEDDEKSFAGTLITCLPVIDPVRGTPVSELRPGDVIEVKIQGGIGASGLIRQYLTSTSQDAVFPVETVEKKSDDKIYVILNINEEVKGLLSISKDLRLRTIRKNRSRKKISVHPDNAIFFGTIAVASIVLLLAVRFLFF